jgi:hypothetical protein
MTSAEDGAETPYDLVSSYLNRRIQLDKNGQVIVKNQNGNTELNSDGSPKSVVQKMHEIKQGTLKNLFISAKDSSQNNLRVNDSEQKFAIAGNQRQIGKPTYTREQARKGKADISAICRRPVCQTHDNLPSITVSGQLCPYSACDTFLPFSPPQPVANSNKPIAAYLFQSMRFGPIFFWDTQTLAALTG